ncbi:MAG: acyl-CoA dehydrogenase family protein [Chloroflexota bacterium]
MEFRFSPQEDTLRAEVRGFLRDTLPAEGVGTTVAPDGLTGSDEEWAFSLAFNKKLAEHGWIAPAWPSQYGGLDATYIEQLIFKEEFAYHRAPDGGRVFGIDMLGPVLMVHGNDEQRARFLPRLTRGEDVWCQGFSEPGSGSDLASLRTTAEKDGDDYVVNGQKIWTTGAHRADWIFALARTDQDAPKHKGISFLMIDMKSPGVEVRPLINMADSHEFNEVFFDNVRVPATNRVGPENHGWYVAMTLLDFERSNVGAVAAGRRTLEDLAVYMRETGMNGAAGKRAKQTMADLQTGVEVGRMWAYRIASMQQAGRVPNYEASVAKVYNTELNQRIYNFAMNLLGPYAELAPGSKYEKLRGRLSKEYMENTATTIYSGTSEIQRNIIAQRGLGLPR